jgi:AraC-like DNA-binding protein
VLQTLLGPGWKALRICFAHDAPADRSTHERVFGRIVDFGHDFNGIVLRRKDLDVDNADADPVLARYARGLVDNDLSNKPVDMTEQVHQLVGALLAKGRCTINLAARHLGVTRRTVHRQLAEHGRTFSEILEEVRADLATRYIAEKHRSLAEISTLLGFAAPSGFSRWYRRHFKGAPSQRRKRTPRRKR